jgi:hypothetical protein
VNRLVRHVRDRRATDVGELASPMRRSESARRPRRRQRILRQHRDSTPCAFTTLMTCLTHRFKPFPHGQEGLNSAELPGLDSNQQPSGQQENEPG